MSRGGQAVLTGVTFDLTPGSAWLLRGANGSGKTSLLRLLAGQLWPSAGLRHYRVPSQAGAPQPEPTSSPILARRRLGLVTPADQDRLRTLPRPLSALEVVMSGAHGLDYPPPNQPRAVREVAERLLEQVGADNLAARPAASLSNGELRRVWLARAVMARPAAVFLDEHLEGVDAESLPLMSAMLTALRGDGVAVVLAGHRDELAGLTTLDGELYMDTAQLTITQFTTSSTPPTAPRSGAAPAQPQIRSTHASQSPPQAPLFTARAASVFVNGVLVLHDLDWTVGSADHWLVSGANGSGKSTLARLVAGDESAAWGGIVAWPGLNEGRFTLPERRQSITLYSPELHARHGEGRPWTVRAVLHSGFDGLVGYPRILNPNELAQADTTAARMGLADLLERPVATLSFGQLKRLLLARALSPGARLTVLDEPFDGLDVAARSALTLLLVELAGQRQFIITAHSAHDAPGFLNRHLRLRAGRAEVLDP